MALDAVVVQVAPRVAAREEHVVPPHGVLHHLDQRHPVLIVVFRMQPRHRIGMAHQRARGRHVQGMLDAPVQLAGVKALEIGALPPVDVKDLDVVAGLDEIAFRRRRFHPQIEDRVGQRIGQVMLPDHARPRALHQNRHRCRRVLSLRCHRRTRSGQHHPALVRCRQIGPRPRRSFQPEHPQRTSARQVDLPRRQGLAQPRQALVARGKHRLQPLGARV